MDYSFFSSNTSLKCYMREQQHVNSINILVFLYKKSINLTKDIVTGNSKDVGTVA